MRPLRCFWPVAESAFWAYDSVRGKKVAESGIHAQCTATHSGLQEFCLGRTERVLATAYVGGATLLYGAGWKEEPAVTAGELRLVRCRTK